jgi:hypothetical protein
MKRYIEHIRSKPTHERRQHAVQVASVITGIIFIGWLGALGVRMGSGNGSPVAAGPQDQSPFSQLANVASSMYSGFASGSGAPSGSQAASGVEVATSSVYGTDTSAGAQGQGQTALPQGGAQQ